MSLVYQVSEWSQTFENNKSRERDQCSYVCIPNKQHGMGFSRLMAEPDGAAIYGIWQLIVGAVSRQRKHRDGWLTDDGHSAGTAWAPADMAALWRRPAAEIERALEVLSSARIGWLLAHKIEVKNEPFTEKKTLIGTQVPVKCPSSAPSRASEEEKGIEENRRAIDNPAGEPSAAESGDQKPNSQFNPPTKQQVINTASMRGIALDCAEAFWLEMDGCGWLDSKSRPVRNWQSLLQRSANNWRSIDHQRAQRNQRPTTRDLETKKSGINSTAGATIREF